jgi:hypothetical protein
MKREGIILKKNRKRGKAKERTNLVQNLKMGEKSIRQVHGSLY